MTICCASVCRSRYAVVGFNSAEGTATRTPCSLRQRFSHWIVSSSGMAAKRFRFGVRVVHFARCAIFCRHFGRPCCNCGYCARTESTSAYKLGFWVLLLRPDCMLSSTSFAAHDRLQHAIRKLGDDRCKLNPGLSASIHQHHYEAQGSNLESVRHCPDL